MVFFNIRFVIRLDARLFQYSSLIRVDGGPYLFLPQKIFARFSFFNSMIS
jgi:hypothetical protein